MAFFTMQQVSSTYLFETLGLDWGSAECKLFRVLHLEVGHCNSNG